PFSLPWPGLRTECCHDTGKLQGRKGTSWRLGLLPWYTPSLTKWAHVFIFLSARTRKESAAMMRNWFIGRNKQKFGPFSTSQLQQLITLGLVTRTEYVLEEGAARWVTVSSVAGLAPPAAGEQKYWLHLGGKNQGPYSAEQIQVSLMRRQLPGDTLACV